MKSIINKNSNVYYQGKYWNDIPRVRKYISNAISGDENVGWIDWFKDKYAKKPFENALFLNCGDGRWDREFVDKRIVKKATAFDISPDLIKKATALKGKRNIQYLIEDANKIILKDNTYDLVVNMAALHHVQYINRLCHQVSKSLTPNGIFLNHDYVGPHRNQYPLTNWLIICAINEALPKNIKKTTLSYPNIPTMLKIDPTEAIHSDLIIPLLFRHFTVSERHDYGGGVAYELLTHNDNLFKSNLESLKVDKQIKKILQIDKLLTSIKLVPVFFSLIVVSKKTIRIDDMKYYQNAENIRETLSSKTNQIYFVTDLIKLILLSKSWKERFKILINYVKVHISYLSI